MSKLGVVEFTEYIAPDGSVYQFDTTDRFLISEEGLGMPPVEYITQKGPYQHGSSLIDYRLQERTVQLILRDDACNRSDYWSHRAALLDAVRPNRYVGYNFDAGTLRKKFSDGTMRDLKVIIEQGPIFGPRSTDRWDEFGYTETLRFIAHDPIFYNPVLKTVTWDPVIGADHLIFPATFPIQFSIYSIFDSSVVNYTGTWFSFPTFVITGPHDHLVITNQSTGEKIEFDYNISPGETVTITLRYGNKTIVNNSGVNLIGTITTDSDLSTFHLAPAPEVSGGLNTIGFVSQNPSNDSTVVMSYYERFIGI